MEMVVVQAEAERHLAEELASVPVAPVFAERLVFAIYNGLPSQPSKSRLSQLAFLPKRSWIYCDYRYMSLEKRMGG